MSDSSYAAATRHRRPYSKAGRPPVLELIDDKWAADALSDDDIDVGRQEAILAGVLEEGELDADAVVVSTGNSASTAMNAERRRRDEGWNDLGLDQFDTTATTAASGAGRVTAASSSSGGGGGTNTSGATQPNSTTTAQGNAGSSQQ